jgi:hypothetical protein
MRIDAALGPSVASRFVLPSVQLHDDAHVLRELAIELIHDLTSEFSLVRTVARRRQEDRR